MSCYYLCYRWRIRDRNRSGISQALKSILLSSTFASALLSFRFPNGFLCNRRVTVPPERANRLPSWYSQINTTIIRQQTQFNFSLFTVRYSVNTKKRDDIVFQQLLISTKILHLPEMFTSTVHTRSDKGLKV